MNCNSKGRFAKDFASQKGLLVPVSPVEKWGTS